VEGGFWEETAASGSSLCGGLKQLMWGEERRAFRMVLVFALVNQGSGSSAIIEYAPTLLKRQGMDKETAGLMGLPITMAKLMGIGLALKLIDRWGRRPLLIMGWFAMSAWMVVICIAESTCTTCTT
jgi:MFS family permease